MSKTTYTANRRIKWGKKTYEAGSPIDLDTEDATPLLEVKAISDPDDPGAEVTPAPAGGAAPSFDELERARRLDDAEAVLAEGEKALLQRKGELDTRTADLDAREAEISKRAAEVKLKDWMLSDPGFREARLKAAIKKVVEGKAKADFTQGGEPTTEAVEKLAGENITAAERSQWFAELYPDTENAGK